MNNPFKLLSKKFRVNARPKIGATLTLTALNKKQPNLVWRNLILTGVPWLLICFVLLVAWLSNQPNPAFSMTRIYITLGLYGLYVLMLEVTSRLFKEQYESTWFQIGRVVVNYLIVTALVLLSPRAGSYFWFFYCLPILQSIVFFRARGVLLVGVSSLTTYWGVIIFARNYLHEPGNPVAVLVNSLVLTLTSFALYWLFHSAKENQAENIALSAKTQRSLIRLETLNQINGQINSAKTLKEILQVALTDGLRGVRTNEGSIMFVQPITGELAINAWIAAGQFKQDKSQRTLVSKEGIAGYVATTGKAYNCPDTSCDHRFVSSLTGRRPRSLLCVPIVAQGPVLGVINADHPMPNFFEQEDVEFLSALAGNLAIAIEKKELYDKVLAERDRSAWIATMLLELQTATTKMQSELELSALLNLISAHAAKLLNADSGGVLLLDETQQFLQFHGSYGLADKTVKETNDKVGASIAGRVVKQASPLIVNNVPNDPRFDNPAATNEGFLSIISTPMWRGEQIIGTLDIHSKTKTNAFTHDDLTILSLMARHAEGAIKKVQMFEREHHQNQTNTTEKKAREEELRILGQFLHEALTYGIDEQILIESLLRKIHEFLRPLSVKLGVLLKDWERAEGPRVEPTEVRRQYFLVEDQLSISTEQNIYRGISGRALKSGIVQDVTNVNAPEWEKLFENGSDHMLAELDVPIRLGEQIIGVFNLEARQVGAFTSQHIAALQRFASASALALDNVRRQHHLHTLLRTASAVHRSSRLDETLRAIAQEIQKAIPNLTTLIIWCRNPKDGQLILGEYFGVLYEEALKRETPAKNGIVKLVMDSPDPIEVSDVQNDSRFKHRAFTVREKIRSMIAFPLRVQNEVIGAMFFNYRIRHEFTAEERTLFPLLAEYVATSINDALLLEKAAKEHKRLSMALGITETVGAELGINDILTNILAWLIDDHFFANTTPCILLFNKTEHILEFSPASRALYKIDNPHHANLSYVKLDATTIAGSLALKSFESKTEQILYDSDVNQSQSYMRARQNTQSQLTVTLYSELQGLLGVLVLESAEPNAFDADAELIALGVARQLTIVLERTHLVAAMRRKDVVASAAFWAVDVAHHVNSETGLIRNWANFLKQETELSEEGQEYLENIKHSAARLAGLMVNVSSKWREPEELDSRQIEAALQGFVQDILEEKDIVFKPSYSFYPSCARVKIELLSLQKIVRYIIQNALEAIDSAPQQWIEIRTLVRAQHFEIQFEDSGPGIPDLRVRQAILNEPIPSTKGDGHGYGLLFANDAVERSGGILRLLPYTPDKGATFAISFPVISNFPIEENHDDTSQKVPTRKMHLPAAHISRGE